MGGLLPWKCGEGPVQILPTGVDGAPVTGILSFGSIHTNSPESATVRARELPFIWDHARVFTGLSPDELADLWVRPGSRVVLHPERRKLTRFGDYISGPFFDDRADLVAMMLAAERLADTGSEIVFAATAAEEVGGHGALYLLRRLQPEVGIALEIGPSVPESRFDPDDQPTVWVSDGYSAMRPSDIALVADAALEAKLEPHWQALSRGGSDATCAASNGLLARPITLGFAAENSHGWEITHKNAIDNLARLLLSVLSRV